MLNHLTIPVELNWMLSKKVWVLSNIHLTQLLFLLNIECYWVLLTPCYNSWVGTCALDIRPLMCVCVCVSLPLPLPLPYPLSYTFIHSFIHPLTYFCHIHLTKVSILYDSDSFICCVWHLGKTSNQLQTVSQGDFRASQAESGLHLLIACLGIWQWLLSLHIVTCVDIWYRLLLPNFACECELMGFTTSSHL